MPRRKHESGNEPDSNSGDPPGPYGGEDKDGFREYEYYEDDEGGSVGEHGHGGSSGYQYAVYDQTTCDTYQPYTTYIQEQRGQGVYDQSISYDNQHLYRYNLSRTPDTGHEGYYNH
ncbi:hypothetical protein DRE_04170 [Drechslerella stenobrocha 248]|uniref:Uncharacterized protein n=1 Tax=Drechslerella stenobrocha 248 TaxID=1043628 RepID=W7I3B9_9PEZI|nr:hypothetical protein DRE_04170 [Drechslerella stenobrocha 248]